LTPIADSREQEQKQNTSVASRVDRGLTLVAGGGNRAAETALLPGESRGSASSPRMLEAEAVQRAPAFAGEHTLSELFPANPRDAGWTGFVLAQLGPGRPLLWVQERMAIREGGRVHAAGLGPLGPHLIHVEACDARSALWAMEEGLRCPSLSGVVGEIWGDPQALDFTATRRLAVAAERTGVACWLVRPGGHASLSGARERWRLASAPSVPHPFDPKAPGTPRWAAELFRSRLRAPGQWLVGDEPADLLPVAAAAGDRTLGGPVRRTG